MINNITPNKSDDTPKHNHINLFFFACLYNHNPQARLARCKNAKLYAIDEMPPPKPIDGTKENASHLIIVPAIYNAINHLRFRSKHGDFISFIDLTYSDYCTCYRNPVLLKPHSSLVRPQPISRPSLCLEAHISRLFCIHCV